MSVVVEGGKFVRFVSLITETAGPRKLENIHKLLAWIISLGFSAFYFYTAFFGMLSASSHLGIYFMLTFVLTFLYFKRSKCSPHTHPEIFDYILVAVTIISLWYWIFQYDTLIMRLGWQPEQMVVFLGIVTILLSLEAARRVSGIVIPFIALVFLVYAYLGPYMPSVLKHSGYPVWRIVEFSYITNEGMLGQITNIFASYIFIFIIFGAFLEKSGLGELFVDTSLALTGHLTGGPGIVATLACGLMGMISGSPVANVVTTGAFTIPLMKRVGYSSEFSGAVCAAASTGGQYMPPVMGAAAFILAEFTGTPYLKVVLISIIPAVLYFASVGLMVYLRAKKKGLTGIAKTELPSIGSVLKRGYLFFPIVIIIFLMVKGYSPFYAACWGTIATVSLSWLSPRTFMSPKMILQCLANGARNSLPVGALAGCLGVVLAMSLLTGLPSLLSGALTKLSFGSLPLLIFWLIVCGYIIGMGLPATPAYLILSLFGVPALAKLGVVPLAAHLIVFWVAVSSVITPPVALAAMAAASISGGNFYTTGFMSVKLGSWLFLMPYLFVYTPLLMPEGFNLQVAVSILTALCGLIAWASAVEGYMLKPLHVKERVALFASAFLLLYAGGITDIIGFVILAAIALNQKFLFRRGASVS